MGKQANKEIMDKVIKIVVEKLEVKAWEATARASFVDDLGADSLDIVSYKLFMFLFDQKKKKKKLFMFNVRFFQ